MSHLCKSKLWILAGTVAIVAFIICCVPQTEAGEYHGGGQSQCSDCHIMHGTENNVKWIVTEPLLKHAGGQTALCLSCHDGTDSSSPDIVAGGTGFNPTSQVSTPYTSKYGSSAGFFQSDCMTSSSPFGHDLFSSGPVAAPLSTTYAKNGPLVCSDCHDSHGSPNYRNLLSDPNPNYSGATTITLGVNVNQTVAVNPVTPNPSIAYDSSNVSFYETNNFKAWCTDCHDVLAQETPGSPPAHFMKHPSDAAFSTGAHVNVDNWVSGSVGQDTGFGSEIGDGVAGIPRLRFGSASGSSTAVSPSDTVFCLSCHKAHGSKYKAALVWPYHTPGADTLSGCQQCHSK